MTLKPEIPRDLLGPERRKPQDLAARGDAKYTLSIYKGLGPNKIELFQTLNRLRCAGEEKRVIIAMAMQETTHMHLDQRDASKDDKGLARNVSILNCNMDMMRELGYVFDDGDALNAPESLPIVCAYLLRGIRRQGWGTRKMLDFHRGGRSGFNDGVSYDCYGYRNAIATMLPLLRADLKLARSDDRRIEIDVGHV